MVEYSEKERAYAAEMQQKYIDKVLECGYPRLTQESAKEIFTLLFEIAEESRPLPKEIVICGSPHECQRLANQHHNNDSWVHYSPLPYSYFTDGRYVTEYEAAIEMGKIDKDDNAEVIKNFWKYKKCLDNSLFYTLVFDDIIFTSQPPVEIHVNDNFTLDNRDGPSVLFENGDATYHIEGIAVPEKYVMDRDSITREDVVKEENAELRRLLFELLGPDRFAEIMDLELIDMQYLESIAPESTGHDLENLANKVKTKKNIPSVISTIKDSYSSFIEKKQEVSLLKTRDEDSLVGEPLYFLRVICHSTGRLYHLGVPKFNDALEALAWTFGMKKEEFTPHIET